MGPKGSGLLEEAFEEGRVGVVGYGQSGASFSMSIALIRYKMCNRIDPVEWVMRKLRTVCV